MANLDALVTELTALQVLERRDRPQPAALDAFCRRIAVPLFRAETDLPFEDLVLRIFRAGGFLR